VCLAKRLSTAVFVGLVAGAFALAAPAGAAVSKCQAKNVTLATKESPNLQGLINAAGSGDSIQVKGVCVGNFTIAKSLTVFGKPTKEVPNPTLDGNAAGRVVEINGSGTVSFSDLTITNGAAAFGAGLTIDGANVSLMNVAVRDNVGKPDPPPAFQASAAAGISKLGEGALTFNGASTVSHNTATITAGVNSRGGSVTLNDAATITDNSAVSVPGVRAGDWGGMAVFGGPLTLNDSSSVKYNSADGSIGGVNNGGMLTLNDQASVHHNTAGQVAGGIWNNGGLALNDQATVHHNTAGIHSGGILHCSGETLTGVVTDGPSPNVFDNTPSNLETFICL
jgi:hypothetical protein